MLKCDLKFYLDQYSKNKGWFVSRLTNDSEQIKQLKVLYSQLKNFYGAEVLPKNHIRKIEAIAYTPTTDKHTARIIVQIRQHLADFQAGKEICYSTTHLITRLDKLQTWLADKLKLDQKSIHKCIAFLDGDLRMLMGKEMAVINNTELSNYIIDNYGCKILCALSQHGQLKPIELLLKQGANIYKKYHEGAISPIAYVVITKPENWQKILKLFMKYDRGTVQERSLAFCQMISPEMYKLVLLMQKKPIDFNLRATLNLNALGFAFTTCAPIFNYLSASELSIMLDIICSFIAKVTDFDIRDPNDNQNFSIFIKTIVTVFKDETYGAKIKEQLLDILTEQIVTHKLALASPISINNQQTTSFHEFLNTVDAEFAEKIKVVAENPNIIRYQREAKRRPNFFNNKDPQLLIATEAEKCTPAKDSVCTIKFNL